MKWWRAARVKPIVQMDASHWSRSGAPGTSAARAALTRAAQAEARSWLSSKASALPGAPPAAERRKSLADCMSATCSAAPPEPAQLPDEPARNGR